MGLYIGLGKISGNGVNGLDGRDFDIDGQYPTYEEMIAANPNPETNLTFQVADTEHIWEYSVLQSKWNDLGTLKGPKGDKGDTGQDGAPGRDGQDGADGQDGQPGKNGTNGLSAYQIAVEQGFQGSETEWLTSLKGADGQDGQPGKDGKPGQDGIDGKNGTNGKDATVNGVNTLTIAEGDNITILQSDSTLTISNPNLDKAPHTTLTVTAMTEGFGFKADYSANDIKRHADAGGVVILRFNAPDGSGEQSYNYETYKDNYAIFRRAIVNPTSNYVSRIIIKIDSNKNVTQEEEKIDINGKTGADGKSAYEIAVENGFKGTEQQWLASLKGEPGEKGDSGREGAPGLTGPKGEDGTNGKDGVSPTFETSKVGNTATIVITDVNGTHTVTLTDGTKGDTGEKGATGETGAAGKDGTNGTDGLSAYQQAQAAGYAGTEETFVQGLAEMDEYQTLAQMQAYFDQKIGELNAILDDINGEVI